MAEGEKKCPECAEMVRAEAVKCRFCGYRWGGNEASSTGPSPAAVHARPAPRKTGMPMWVVWLVVGIVGGLGLLLILQHTAASVAADFSDAREDLDLSTAQLLTRIVGTTVSVYRTTHHEYPESLEAFVEMRPPRLRPEQLEDPWGQKLSYEIHGIDFRVCSSGPDKRAGSSDDVCFDSRE